MDTKKKQIEFKAGSICDGLIANYVPAEYAFMYKDGFKDGANWAYNEFINKACEWLLKGGYFINSNETIEDFRKAMEE